MEVDASTATIKPGQEAKARRSLGKEKSKGGIIQRLGTGKFSHYAKTAALAAMLGGSVTGGPGTRLGKELSAETDDKQKQEQVVRSEARAPAKFVMPEPGETPFHKVDLGAQPVNSPEEQQLMEKSTLPIGEQAATRRRLRREQVQDQRLKEQGVVKTATAEKTTVEEGEAGGMKGRLRKARMEIGKSREQIAKTKKDLLKGKVGAQAASMAIVQVQRTVWTTIHTTLEDIWFDAKIISGPAALLAFTIRVVFAYLLGGVFTIRAGGIEVPMVPKFANPLEGLARLGINLLIALVVAVEWLLVAAIAYVIFNPIDVVKWTVGWVVKSMLGF